MAIQLPKKNATQKATDLMGEFTKEKGSTTGGLSKIDFWVAFFLQW